MGAGDALSETVNDKRALLEYVLKDYVKRGGKLVVPPATAFNSSALLDGLDVAAVLRAMPYTASPLELARLGRGSGAGHAPPPARTPGSTAPLGPLTQPTMGQDGIPTYTFPAASSGGGSSNPFTRPSNASNASDGGRNPFLSDSGPLPVQQAQQSQPAGGRLTGTPPVVPQPQQQPGQAHHMRHASAPPSQQLTPPAVQKRLVYQPYPNTSDGHLAGDEQPAAVAEQPLPEVQLPLLQTDVSADHLRELAYLMVCAALPAQGPGAGQGTLPRPPGKGGAISGGNDTTALLTALRGQLELDEATARDVSSVLRHVSAGYWTAQRRCSLEGLMVLLAQARPNDFNMLGGGSRGFKGWVRWRQGLAAVLAAAAQHKHGALQGSPQSKRLLARLKGALRRLDVLSPEELDEEEYGEAAAAMKDAVRGLAFCGLRPASSAGAPVQGQGWTTFDGHSTPQGNGSSNGAAPALISASSGQLDANPSTGAGWHLPWVIRARVAQVLIDAMFDTINEGSYIDEVTTLQAALDAHVWPALGVSPTLALALLAWTHFRQYLATGQPWLARQLKLLITKLSSSVTAVRAHSLKRNSSSNSRRHNSKSAAPTAGPGPLQPLTPEDESEADSQVASQVGRLVVEHLVERLADYHQHFPPGQEQPFQVMLDTAVSAARARGDSEASLCGLLLDCVTSSVAAQWQRCMEERAAEQASEEATLLEALACAEEVAQAEASRFAAILGPHLPQHTALVAARLHTCVGDLLLPWLRRGVVLDPASVDVLRAAVRLNTHFGQQVAHAQQQLGTSLQASTLQRQQSQQQHQAAAAGTAQPQQLAGQEGAAAPVEALQVVHDALRSFLCWQLDIPTQQALDKWVVARVQAMSTWVDRQLGLERWQPCNNTDAYSQSSVEVVSLVLETLEALFVMQLPVPRPSLAALLQGIDAAITKYAGHILEKMGSPGRLIPPNPTVTRYKKPFVVKQEELEADLAFAANPGLGKRPKAKGSMTAGLKSFGKSLIASSTPPKAGTDEPTGFLESVPTIQSHPEFASLKGFTATVIACFIMSAQHLVEKLELVISLVCSKWQPVPKTMDTAWVGTCFQGCRQQLTSVIGTACVFLATKAVFWDMRHEWLEQLYRHHVPSKGGSAQLPPPFSCRIDPLFGGLNEVLAEACGRLPDALRSRVAKELLAAAAVAWQRVLLDGGPCRWFIPADVGPLREDLDAVHHLFTADGEGLPREVVEPILRPCYRLLLLVGCELNQLMSLLRTARLHGKATLTLPGHEPEVFVEGVLMRVLARRPDRTGSKLLKKEYKMGRRLHP